MATSDTVADRFHRPLRRAETAGDWLFYLAAVVSIAALLVSRKDNPVVYDAIQIVFVLTVVGSSAIGLLARLYLFPRAAEQRRRDLLSIAFAVPLTHETSVGYYNNAQTNPLRRLGASTMESAFFSTAIAAEMLWLERARIAIYFGLWIIALMIRNTDLGFISVAAQVVFGEQVLSRWIRMEWLRSRSNRVYDHLHQLFSGGSTAGVAHAQAQIIERHCDYEEAKSTAHILLSDRVYKKRNRELSAEWDQIRASIGL